VVLRESINGKPKGLLQIGTRVWVRECCREPYLRGLMGTIKRRYGGDVYAAFEVSFWNGRSELFWRHELEEGNVRW
jgi:hypothetical protein